MSTLEVVSGQTVDGSVVDVERTFEQWIHTSFQRNPELAKKINFVYQINIRQKCNSVITWVLDLTQGTGALSREPRHDIKCSLTLDENDLIRALQDTSHLNTLFIERRMGLKGTRIALEKLQQFWVEADKCNKDFQLIRQNCNEVTDQKKSFDLMTSNGFKSDIIFHTLRNRMHEEASIVRKLTGIMQFDITRAKDRSIWTIDFTKPLSENVYPGPSKDKPVCILTMNDEDFVLMMVNKLNPQKAFMTGKMKVKGQLLAIYKLFSVWIDTAFRKKRAPEVPYIEKILLSSDLIPGLKSETMVFHMIQRLVKCPHLCESPAGVYYFDITKGGKVVSKWKLDFTANQTCGVFSRQSIDVKSPEQTLIVIEDEDFILMANNKLNIEKAMASNCIKGDISLSPNLTKIFQSSLIPSKL